MEEKQQRLRWTSADEIVLFSEIIDPFDDADKWRTINEKLNFITNKCYSVRAAKEHFMRLFQKFQREDRASLRK